MIQRYSRPAMACIFTEETKLGLWLAIEKAVLAALVARGTAPREAYEALAAVDSVDVAAVHAREAEIHHDLAAFVDVVGAAAPGAAAWLHYGLTSSDVVDTALALQMQQAGDLLVTQLQQARKSVLALAYKHRKSLMLGRTHGMPAEPTTFGAKAVSWWHQLTRDEERIVVALSACSVGKLSGAVGTYSGVPVDVERAVLSALGLGHDPSATQVVQRDRHAQLLSAMAICAATLERCATEIRHLQRSEVGEAFEPFGSSQKGSSAMPHKRNPIVAERICGLARVVRGYVQTAFENIALWHERDISHSGAERIIIPDAFMALDYMLDRWNWIAAGLEVDEDRMLINLDAQRGQTASQQVLLALVEVGIARDDAYRMVQRAAQRTAASTESTLSQELWSDETFRQAIDSDQDRLEELTSPWRALRNLDSVFSTLPSESPSHSHVHA